MGLIDRGYGVAFENEVKGLGWSWWARCAPHSLEWGRRSGNDAESPASDQWFKAI